MKPHRGKQRQKTIRGIMVFITPGIQDLYLMVKKKKKRRKSFKLKSACSSVISTGTDSGSCDTWSRTAATKANNAPLDKPTPSD